MIVHAKKSFHLTSLSTFASLAKYSVSLSLSFSASSSYIHFFT